MISKEEKQEIKQEIRDFRNLQKTLKEKRMEITENINEVESKIRGLKAKIFIAEQEL